jgi:NitT/TauT family transport system substrate-binding protein
MRNLIILTALLMLSSCLSEDKKQDSRSGPDSVSVHSASVRLNWIPSCSFVGEIVGSEKFAAENNISIKIEAGGPGLDPIKLVQSNTNDFGVAGADLVLAANDKGADLVIIGLVSYNSPGVWLAKEEKAINSIEDVQGKRIGELPGGNMQYLYEVFLKKTGLTRNENFTPVPIPFELKNFIAQDECDLRPVFIYDETSELELRGISYSLIEPKNFGIQFKGICYFTKRATIETNPELVQAFINCMADGWNYSLGNPDIAIQSLKKFDPSIREDKELLGLNKGLDYLKGYDGKVLYTDLESWNIMANDMHDLGFIKSIPNLEKTLDLRFVKDYHSIE